MFPSTDGNAASAFTLGAHGCLAHGLTQGIALQVGICLHPAVGLDDLLGKRGRRQDLSHQRIRVQGNRRYQPLQLFRTLLCIRRGRRFLSLRLLVLRWRLWSLWVLLS